MIYGEYYSINRYIKSFGKIVLHCYKLYKPLICSDLWCYKVCYIPLHFVTTSVKLSVKIFHIVFILYAFCQPEIKSEKTLKNLVFSEITPTFALAYK